MANGDANSILQNYDDSGRLVKPAAPTPPQSSTPDDVKAILRNYPDQPDAPTDSTNRMGLPEKWQLQAGRGVARNLARFPVGVAQIFGTPLPGQWGKDLTQFATSPTDSWPELAGDVATGMGTLATGIGAVEEVLPSLMKTWPWLTRAIGAFGTGVVPATPSGTVGSHATEGVTSAIGEGVGAGVSSMAEKIAARRASNRLFQVGRWQQRGSARTLPPRSMGPRRSAHGYFASHAPAFAAAEAAHHFAGVPRHVAYLAALGATQPFALTPRLNDLAARSLVWAGRKLPVGAAGTVANQGYQYALPDEGDGEDDDGDQ